MKLSSWVEITGLIAVVTSLVFVGLEIRQNSQASKTANQHALLEMALNYQNTIMQDEELSEIYQAMLEGSEPGLTKEQQGRASQIRGNQFNLWESAFYAHDTGQLNDELWAAWNGFNRSLINDQHRAWWKKNRQGFGESFSSHVDSVLSQAP